MKIPGLKKKNQTSPPDWLVKLEETTAKSYPHLPTKIQESLIVWRKRFEIYDDPEIASTLKNATYWKQNRRFRKESDKLIKAIHALDQLATTKTKPAHAAEMQQAIIKIIEIKLTKLLLDQNKILSKAQNLHRNFESITALPTNAVTHKQKNIELEKMRAESAALLKERNEDFLKSAQDNKLHHTHHFFKERERRWHYDKHLKRARHASVILNLFNATIDIIRATLPAFILAGTVAIAVLKAIPLTGSIIAAVPVLMKAVKVWIKNQDDTKRGLAIFGILLMAAGFVTAGLTAFASSIFAAVLVTVGGFINRIIPLRTTQKLLSSHTAELKELNQHDEKLIPLLKSLKNRERQYLLIEVENFYLKNQLSKADFMQLKTDVLRKDYYTLKANTYLQKILVPHELDAFLYNNIKQRKVDLEIDIRILRKKRNEHITGALNTGITLIGTLLFPFFPIAGAALLIVSAVMGVSRQFSLTQKSINLLKSFFYKIKSFFTEKKSALKIQNINSNVLTAEMLKTKENLKPVEKNAIIPTKKEDLKHNHTITHSSLHTPKKPEIAKSDENKNEPHTKKPENQN